MGEKTQKSGLQFIDDFVAEGRTSFTFAEAMQYFHQSPSATGNILQRLKTAGLIERVRRGYYAIRQLGVLGTPSVSEDIALAVSAAFSGIPHRMAYLTALAEHDLIVHPVSSIYVATSHRIRANTLSGRPLHIVNEHSSTIDVGAIACGASRVSNIERAILESAMRPNLVGGASIMATAIFSAKNKLDIDQLGQYAKVLSAAAAIRRIGSIADTLEIKGLARQFQPINKINADLDLEPGTKKAYVWRDSFWHVRWHCHPEEIANVINQ